MYSEFVLTPMLERSIDGLLDDDAMRELERVLIERPDAGGAISQTGGARKIRIHARGHGKRGGARVIYVRVPRCDRIYFFLLAFPKNVAATLSSAGNRTLRSVIAEIMSEECG